jgi:S1-C subfamily serine protease
MSLTFYHSGKAAACACAAVLLAALLALPAGRAISGEERPAAQVEMPLPTLAPLIKRVRPAVVAVTSRRQPPGWIAIDPGGGFPDAPMPQELTVAGSGVIVDADLGLVVTSYHVIEDAEAVTVTLSDGRSQDATILAHSDQDDLALLRIAPGRLTALELGEATGVEVGDFIVAIGNPLGAGQSMTFGIVSALHRSCPGIGNTDLIVIDALIEKGNSGGPLVNLRGQLIGINVARAGDSNAAGFGFSVPANAIRDLLAQARLNG